MKQPLIKIFNAIWLPICMTIVGVQEWPVMKPSLSELSEVTSCRSSSS